MNTDGSENDKAGETPETSTGGAKPAQLPQSSPDSTTYLAAVAADHELDRAALSELGEPVVLMNEDGMIVRVNHEAEMLTGYTQLELLGQLIETLVPSMQRTKHVQHRNRYMSYPQARQMGSHLAVELSLLTKQHKEQPVRISLKPLIISRGRFVSAVVRLRDEVR